MNLSKRARQMCLFVGVFCALSAVAAKAARLEDIDINGDGLITEAEFAEYFARGNYQVPKKIARAAMEKYDLDQSGVVTLDEVAAVGRADGRGNTNGNAAGAPSNPTSTQGADAPGNSSSGQSNGPGNSNGSGNSGGGGGGSGNGGGQGGGSGNGGRNR